MNVIEVFADVACPFTHVGLLQFVQRREASDRDDVVLFVRSWPLEIVNDRPLDPAFIAEEVDDIRTQLHPEMFAGFDERAFPSTSLPAMTLAAAAYEADPRTGERVSLELRDLLFERGIDIADRDVLRRVASEHGVEVDLDDHTRVLADHVEGTDRAVVGSPHFFTPAGSFFCPSLDVGRDANGHLRITADAAFDDFVAACFDATP